MADLNKLPPAALRAALATGTAEWEQWGSVQDHALYVQELPPMSKGWRRCKCGCNKKRTHAVMANGVAMAWGCEVQAHRLKRKLEATR